MKEKIIQRMLLIALVLSVFLWGLVLEHILETRVRNTRAATATGSYGDTINAPSR